MKRLATVVLALGIVFFAGSAFGEPDLTGFWCIHMSEAYSSDQFPQDNVPPPGDLPFNEPIPYEIEILDKAEQDFGVGFHGIVYPPESSDRPTFSGMLVGRDIYFTHWDSVTTGRLQYRGRLGWTIRFVNHAFFADDRESKTSAGIAIKGECPAD